MLQVLTRRVLYSNIRGLHANLDKLPVAESDFDVLVCAESKVSDLDTYDGINPLGEFPLFLKMFEDFIAPKLSIIFRGLIHRGSFPECWRSAIM